MVDRDVVAVSSGFMHHAVLKNDGSLWMWGRQLCGEFGNGSTEASPTPVRVVDGGIVAVACGLQTTAIIKDDGSLWMCGRNDLGQIDESRESHHNFVHVADDVSEVQLGWGTMHIVKTDGTTETRTWDETADEGRAVEPAYDVAGAVDVQYGWQNAVALDVQGAVWTWNADDSEPVEMLAGHRPQKAEGIAILTETLTVEKEARAVISMRPVPLMADYDVITYISSDAIVAAVDDRGVVTGRTDGEAVVTATLTDLSGQRYDARCKVRVGTGTGISDLADDDWLLAARTVNHTLHVSGVPAGVLVRVYSLSGTCVHQERMAASAEVVTQALPDGVYLVRAERQVKKMVVR